jgi:hypothetical protein
MLRVYKDRIVGPVPQFPREMEEGIDEYLKMEALEASAAPPPLPVTDDARPPVASPVGASDRFPH